MTTFEITGFAPEPNDYPTVELPAFHGTYSLLRVDADTAQDAIAEANRLRFHHLLIRALPQTPNE